MVRGSPKVVGPSSHAERAACPHGDARSTPRPTRRYGGRS
jgi:hypothetical protein